MKYKYRYIQIQMKYRYRYRYIRIQIQVMFKVGRELTRGLWCKWPGYVSGEVVWIIPTYK